MTEAGHQTGWLDYLKTIDRSRERRLMDWIRSEDFSVDQLLDRMIERH
jgi:hypothetical protein